VLPDEFWTANAFGVRGGVEYAFTSTTTNREVALKYASTSKVGMVLEVQMGMVDRGAELEWLSQVRYVRVRMCMCACACAHVHACVRACVCVCVRACARTWHPVWLARWVSAHVRRFSADTFYSLELRTAVRGTAGAR